MTKNNKIGKHVAEARHHRNLTQGQLAKLIGVSENTISMFERGERNPSIGTIEDLSQALRVSIDFLVKGERRSIDCSDLDDREFDAVSELIAAISDNNTGRTD